MCALTRVKDVRQNEYLIPEYEITTFKRKNLLATTEATERIMGNIYIGQQHIYDNKILNAYKII